MLDFSNCKYVKEPVSEGISLIHVMPDLLGFSIIKQCLIKYCVALGFF